MAYWSVAMQPNPVLMLPDASFLLANVGALAGSRAVHDSLYSEAVPVQPDLHDVLTNDGYTLDAVPGHDAAAHPAAGTGIAPGGIDYGCHPHVHPAPDGLRGASLHGYRMEF